MLRHQQQVAVDGGCKGSSGWCRGEDTRIDDAARRAEVERLFSADRSGATLDWSQAALAIADHIVWERRPTGVVAEADVDWLLGLAGDQPSAFGRAMLFAVVREADCAPARLVEAALRSHRGRWLLS